MSRPMNNHEMQHPNSPTWCVHCGTFDIYAEGECDGPRDRRFDASAPANFDRMVRALFGEVATNAN